MEEYIEDLTRVLLKLDLGLIRSLTLLIRQSPRIWIVGNGGSMSTATHFAEDLIKLADKKAVAVSCPSLLSMCANDYGDREMFSFPLSKLADLDDLVILISTSGRSPNIVKVIESIHCKKFLITGLGGQFADVGKLVIKSYDVQILEDVSLIITHMVCKYYGREQ